ncbi:hypothetical protein [Pseudomonas chlororaphis]|uniref:hypothetical protein n=1 Tax=Pseudomonas chlororaphis TaxID=587753 RepID=UPI0009B92EB7|nr:hypothetical protein [Pseudomonas chlororaphis]AZD27648.1 hypothetical protein C4K23_0879 [Pseudomonas chlororaphis]QFS53242.1 hypothetical protein FD951_01330 [Pseudomonas chlororaphis subsp. aurantiaca]
MRKTFPLQVWQTAGLILGVPPSHATGNLHSDNFTASHNVNTADDVLFTRHRLQDPGHPFSTASSDAPTGGTAGHERPVRRQPMHQKKPAHTVKFVNIYTNASFLYVRSTP